MFYYKMFPYFYNIIFAFVSIFTKQTSLFISSIVLSFDLGFLLYNKPFTSTQNCKHYVNRWLDVSKGISKSAIALWNMYNLANDPLQSNDFGCAGIILFYVMAGMFGTSFLGSLVISRLLQRKVPTTEWAQAAYDLYINVKDNKSKSLMDVKVPDDQVLSVRSSRVETPKNAWVCEVAGNKSCALVINARMGTANRPC